MTPEQQMEALSEAYVRAVAAAAQVSVSIPEVDDDSVDIQFIRRARSEYERPPRLEAQLKCTYAHELQDGCISYPLKIKNYNDLRRKNVCVPRILIVVCVPEDATEWLKHSHEHLTLKKCGYWVDITGHDETSNGSTVTVSVPETNIFDTENLSSLLDKIAAGKMP